jgi:hypothetical protein
MAACLKALSMLRNYQLEGPFLRLYNAYVIEKKPLR